VLVLKLDVGDPAALRALFEDQLSKRRVFVPGADAGAEPGACELAIEHAGRAHRVAAEVVYVRAEEPGRGVGLSLAAMDGAAMDALRAFACPEERGERGEREGERAATGHDSLRGLSSAEQQRMAASAGLSERIALERMYGPNVWETLLRNPRLTIPEVARIARKGTLPRPLVDVIAAAASWLAAPEVQRALLSNPRASAAVVSKILHAMPRNDLARVPQQTAYPTTVRAAAKKLLGTER
jgi:hypothetical protein